MLDSNQLSLVDIPASSHSTYVSLHYTPCFNCKSEGPCQGPPSLRCENIKSLINCKPFITHNAPHPTSNATIAGSKIYSTMFSPPIYTVFYLKRQKGKPVGNPYTSFNHTFSLIFGFFL